MLLKRIKKIIADLVSLLPKASDWVLWYPRAIIKSLSDPSMKTNFARNRFLVAVISLIVMFPAIVFFSKLLVFVLLPQWQWFGSFCQSALGMAMAWMIGMFVAFGSKLPASVRAGIGAFLVVSFWLTPVAMIIWIFLKWQGVW